eukprot:CAMPEP_0173405504 /NCGR_PEP_ID=MMETSP1356-20130122/61968_1 /TAXON_ID=77927 ORGANISM="Hemiselmis virescens, Strain PCC157" /NCGR_SAMPLE_ID=MMETSP1356 /ASSEMBLY_ACC=CAM_ASM_000847 /LENGTH=81 /DNA_ID=CAMNT_0014366315 /DNA_START=18 /DNA_END=263 /DNA_ORIENTATION=+
MLSRHVHPIGRRAQGIHGTPEVCVGVCVGQLAHPQPPQHRAHGVGGGEGLGAEEEHVLQEVGEPLLVLPLVHASRVHLQVH